MKEEIIDFLEDYKKVCIKHKMWIGGFDDGAYVRKMTESELELECLAFEETHHNDNSVSMSDLRFCGKDEFKNSIITAKTYLSSTLSEKDRMKEGQIK